MQKTKIIALTITVAFVAIALVAGVTFAQTQSPTPTPQTTITPNPTSPTVNHSNCPATNDGTNGQQSDYSQNGCNQANDHSSMMSQGAQGSMMNGYGNGNMMVDMDTAE